MVRAGNVRGVLYEKDVRYARSTARDSRRWQVMWTVDKADMVPLLGDLLRTVAS